VKKLFPKKVIYLRLQCPERLIYIFAVSRICVRTHNRDSKPNNFHSIHFFFVLSSLILKKGKKNTLNLLMKLLMKDLLKKSKMLYFIMIVMMSLKRRNRYPDPGLMLKKRRIQRKKELEAKKYVNEKRKLADMEGHFEVNKNLNDCYNYI
jgi:hypothetical protein